MIWMRLAPASPGSALCAPQREQWPSTKFVFARPYTLNRCPQWPQKCQSKGDESELSQMGIHLEEERAELRVAQRHRLRFCHTEAARAIGLTQKQEALFDEQEGLLRVERQLLGLPLASAARPIPHHGEVLLRALHKRAARRPVPCRLRYVCRLGLVRTRAKLVDARQRKRTGGLRRCHPCKATQPEVYEERVCGVRYEPSNATRGRNHIRTSYEPLAPRTRQT